MRVEEKTTMGSIFARRDPSYQSTISQVEKAEQTLQDLGHRFYNGKLYEVESRNPFTFSYHANHSQNQRRYERLGKGVEDYVYAILQSEAGLKKVYLPFGEKNNSESFIFHSPDLQKKEKILVLMHGSGVVRAGQWSRRLIINESLDAGSMLPYINAGKNYGYGVVVLNTNQNETRAHYSYRLQSSTFNSPESHFNYVWKQLIEKLNKPVAIVTHSYGGSVVMEAAKSIPGFMELTFAVALTDCWISDSPRIQSWLQKKVCNWVTSRKPLGEVTNSCSTCKTVSGGTTVHEETPWKAISHIWDFILDCEQKYIEFTCFALIGNHRRNKHTAGMQIESVINNQVVNPRNCHRDRRGVSGDRVEAKTNERGRSRDRRGVSEDRMEATTNEWSRDRRRVSGDRVEAKTHERGRSRDRRGVSEDRVEAKTNERGRSRDRRGVSEDRMEAKTNEWSRDRCGVSGDRVEAKTHERGRSRDRRGVSGDRVEAKTNERGGSRDRRGVSEDRKNSRVLNSVQASFSSGRKRPASCDSRNINFLNNFKKLSLVETPLKKESLNTLPMSAKSFADILKKNRTEPTKTFRQVTSYRVNPPYATHSH